MRMRRRSFLLATLLPWIHAGISDAHAAEAEKPKPARWHSCYFGPDGPPPATRFRVREVGTSDWLPSNTDMGSWREIEAAAQPWEREDWEQRRPSEHCYSNVEMAQLLTLPIQKLVRLDLGKTMLPPGAGEILQKLTGVTSLSINGAVGPPLPDPMAALFPRGPNEVQASDQPVPLEVFEAIAKMGQLRKLELAGNRLSADQLGLVAGMSALEELNLSQTGLRDENALALKSLRKLRKLSLSNNLLCDAVIDVIAGNNALTHLNLNTTRLTRVGLTRIRDAFPKLLELKVAGTYVGENDAAQVYSGRTKPEITFGRTLSGSSQLCKR